jgi:hypothetical protein
MHWFWDASEVGHGTSSNNIAMSNPLRWKDYIKESRDVAQWTTAQTIPLAVAQAVQRHPQNYLWR